MSRDEVGCVVVTYTYTLQICQPYRKFFLQIYGRGDLWEDLCAGLDSGTGSREWDGLNLALVISGTPIVAAPAAAARQTGPQVDLLQGDESTSVSMSRVHGIRPTFPSRHPKSTGPLWSGCGTLLRPPVLLTCLPRIESTLV